MERQRSVDVEALTEEQLENIQKALGVKMNEIIAEAKAKANKYLNVYGLEAHMQFELNPIQKDNNLKGN